MFDERELATYISDSFPDMLLPTKEMEKHGELQEISRSFTFTERECRLSESSDTYSMMAGFSLEIANAFASLFAEHGIEHFSGFHVKKGKSDRFGTEYIIFTMVVCDTF